MASDEEWLRQISRRVVELRRARGMTQRALATKARLSVSQMFRIEQGANLSVSTLLAVARALGVTPDLLFAAQGTPLAAMLPGYAQTDPPRPQMREAAVERVSTFVQGLSADERRRAIRLLRAAFPTRAAE